MNKKELEFILQEGEGFKLEFKEGLSGIDKDIVAFANANGGRIFLGIDDSKKIKGIKLTNKLKSEIIDVARHCDPSINNLKISYFDNIVVIDVSASSNKPHKCSSGFDLRKDATSQKMSRDEIVDFVYDQGMRQFDSQSCAKFNMKDLDKNFIKEYLSRSEISAKTSIENILFNLGVYGNNKINNAGVLFFSKAPKKYFISAYITCARYLGFEKVNVLDRADFEGNVVYQIEEALKFIRRNTRLSYKIKALEREEIPEYPMEALREAIVNAVMHRNYFERGANVQIDIFDDRVTITNVGALIKPLTPQNLGEISVRRNPLIADLFHRINYVEKMGTGLKRIKDEAKKHNTKVKVEADGFFIVTFQNKKPFGVVNVPVNVPVNDRQKWFLNLLFKNNKGIIMNFAKNFPDITIKTIKRDIAYLTKNKIIEFVGAPKTGYYALMNVPVNVPVKAPPSAIFLDRDGVINRKIDNDYVKKWEEFEFLPYAIAAIKILNEKKIPVYIITNQSGVGRGKMTENDLKVVHDKMISEFKRAGVYVDDIFVCTHKPEDKCDCRKPKPGLLLQAKAKYPQIDFKNSWVIGDSQIDMEAGKAVGCRTYLLGKKKNLFNVMKNILKN